MTLLYLHLEVSPRRQTADSKAKEYSGTDSMIRMPGFGIFYSLLKRQRFQLLLFSFREIKCPVNNPHRGRELQPALYDLKALVTFYSCNKYSEHLPRARHMAPEIKR